MTRIAIATDWYAPRHGGVESQLHQLATGLQVRGHDVVVLTSTPGPSEVDGVPVRRLAVARLPRAGVALTPGILGALRREVGCDVDMVHAHVSVVSPVGYAAAFAAHRRHMPLVLTFHSVLRAKRMLLRGLDALVGLDRAALRWTAVSELVASQLRSALPGAPVAVLPNGLDVRFWSGNGRPAAPAVPTFICAMRLHRKKRPRVLLQAFATALRSTGSSARLAIVGDGPELEGLRRDERQLFGAAGGPVTFLPWQDRAGLRALYAAAAVFVLPSRRESFGLAALEARAAGLPVIAMREAGCREFLRDGENALLCDTDDDLADAMGRLLRDPALRLRLARAGASLDRYDWASVLDAHQRAYDEARELLGRRG